MRQEFRFAGLGGQGAITIGHVLGRAAVIYDGKEAVVTEGYSPYITGGWSRADIIVSDEPIDFPFPTKMDILLAMHQENLEQNAKLLKPNGIVLSERRLVNVQDVRQTRKVVEVPAAETAERLGKKILTNVVMLGSLAALSSAVSLDSLRKALAERFPKAKELNMKALESGLELAKQAEEGLKTV